MSMPIVKTTVPLKSNIFDQRSTIIYDMDRLDTVADRIAWIIRDLGGNDVTFGASINASKQTVGQWKNGQTQPAAKPLLEIEGRHGYRARWILFGELPVRVGEDQGGPPPARPRRLDDMRRAAVIARKLLRDHPETANAMLGAGIGHLIAEGGDNPDEYLKTWLNRSGERRPGEPVTAPPGSPHLKAAEPATAYQTTEKSSSDDQIERA